MSLWLTDAYLGGDFCVSAALFRKSTARPGARKAAADAYPSKQEQK